MGRGLAGCCEPLFWNVISVFYVLSSFVDILLSFSPLFVEPSLFIFFVTSSNQSTVFYAAPLPSLSAKSVPSPIVDIALVSVPLFVSTVLSYAFLPVLIVELALVDTNTVIAVSGGDVCITLSFVVVVTDFLPLIYLALASGNISVGGGESHAHLV